MNELECLCTSRGDLPYRRHIDRSHCGSMHIQADNWALGRSRARRVPAVLLKRAALVLCGFLWRWMKKQKQSALRFMRWQTIWIDLILAVEKRRHGLEKKVSCLNQYARKSHNRWSFHPIITGLKNDLIDSLLWRVSSQNLCRDFLWHFTE